MVDFSAEFLEGIRGSLEVERKRLAHRQTMTVDEILAVHASDAGVLDSIDSTTIEQTATTMLKLKDRELSRLREVNAALDRLSAGEYGYCQRTGEPIEEKRLRANLLARLSLEAQQDLEEDQRRRKFRPGLMGDME